MYLIATTAVAGIAVLFLLVGEWTTAAIIATLGITLMFLEPLT